MRAALPGHPGQRQQADQGHGERRCAAGRRLGGLVLRQHQRQAEGGIAATQRKRHPAPMRPHCVASAQARGGAEHIQRQRQPSSITGIASSTRRSAAVR
jgi:hypothetical protein